MSRGNSVLTLAFASAALVALSCATGDPPGGEDSPEVETCEGADRFECSDGACLSSDAVCDGVGQCGDGSDEADCNNCTPTSFQCDDGWCHPETARCNGVTDCTGGEDEVGCDEGDGGDGGDGGGGGGGGGGGCTSDQFTCNDGSCIAWASRCDGTWNCTSGEDEDATICTGSGDGGGGSGGGSCSALELECGDGSCVIIFFICDGYNDCPDGTDEDSLLCGGSGGGSATCSTGSCGAGGCECSDGTCITSSWWCDGIIDCADDETGC